MSNYVSFFVLFCVVSRAALSFDDVSFFDDGLEEDARPKVERPFIDHTREDDVDEFDLYDIMALTLAEIDYDFDIYTPEQKQLALELHNVYKMNTTHDFPQASDMFMYEYNNTLEYFAYLYLKHCYWGHEFHALDNMTWQQGQNLFRGPSKLISRTFYGFYMEHLMWYHNNYSCWVPYSMYKCGHMTQMMWWNTSHLGTARRSYCFPLDPVMFFNTHYLRDGNKDNRGIYLYKIGWPCTRCPPGYLCVCGKLCVPPRYCTAYNLDCECSLVCKNCGRPDWKRCRCECQPGFDWDDCSFPCQNLVDVQPAKTQCRYSVKQRCGLLPKHEAFFYGCRQWCGQCQKRTKKHKPEQLCCGGKICQDYYELDAETCECKLMCPSWECMWPPSTTTTTPAPPTTTPAETTTTPAPPKSGAVALRPIVGVVSYWIVLPLRLTTSRNLF